MNAEFRYAPPSARSGRRRLLFATIFVVVVVLLDVATAGKIRALVQGAASDVWGAGAHVAEAIGDGGYFSSRASLEAQIVALQNELVQSQLRSAAFAVVEQENTTLSQMTHLAQSAPGITAPVASSVESSPYGTFLIGAGSADGISAGSLVLADDGFIIGKISDLGSHTALVDEFFGPGESNDVVIDGAAVSATGQGGGNAYAEVPRGISVNLGDPVTAPEYSGKSIGVVGHVVSDPASAKSQIYIVFPINLSSLQFVYVTP